MEWFGDLIDYTSNFVHFLSFLFTSIYNYFDDFIRYCMKSLAKLSFWLSYQAMLASAELIDAMLKDLDISSHINRAWSGIPVRERQILSFFKFPEIVNTIFSAISSRFVMRFMPGSGV